MTKERKRALWIMSRIKYIWVVVGAAYYSGPGSTRAYFTKKKDAVATLRAQGYRFNRKDKLFLNSELQWWRRIDKVELFHEAIVSER